MTSIAKDLELPIQTENGAVQNLFPIRVLSEKTGVGTSTLRAWERRYGLLKPNRTPKGHRLFSASDIQKIEKVLEWLEDGHSLPYIAQLLKARSQQDSVSPAGFDYEPQDNESSPAISAWETYKKRTMDAVRDFSVERVDAIYSEASSLYPVDLLTDRLIQPVLANLGAAWASRPGSGIAEEHFYSSWLRNRLGARFHHAYANARGPRIICACGPGSFHEIGLMLFALSAMARGYRVLYFGSNLPLDQLQYVTSNAAAKAVVLSFQSLDDENLRHELKQVIGSLAVPIFVGGTLEPGEFSDIEKSGFIFLGSSIAVAMRLLETRLPANRVSTDN